MNAADFDKHSDSLTASLAAIAPNQPPHKHREVAVKMLADMGITRVEEYTQPANCRCGSKAVLMSSDRFYVTCDAPDCGVIGPRKPDAQAAVDAWDNLMR